MEPNKFGKKSFSNPKKKGGFEKKNEKDRIAKRLAILGVASRRDAEKLVMDGKVKVNNVECRDLTQLVSYDDEIAGYLAYEFDDEGLRLSKLYLLPAFRGKGIGGYLMGYVEERARENGSGMIHLEVNEVNPHAREFYRLHGFVPGERLDYRRIVMRKQLA